MIVNKSMKNTIIIYGSQYGSTKRYAEQLAKLTGLEAVDYKEAKEIEKYDRIVYLGALYAGGVTGLKKTVGKMSPYQKLVIVTVGIADPTDAENIANIRRSVKTQVPAHFYDEAMCLHLRGAIDYSHLGLKHRMMMSLLYSKVKKMPEEELTSEAQALMATYGKQVDFVDLNTLAPIVKLI